MACVSLPHPYIHVLFFQIKNAEHILSKGQANAADLQERSSFPVDQNSLLNCKKFPVLREFGRKAAKARRNAEPLCAGEQLRMQPQQRSFAAICSGNFAANAPLTPEDGRAKAAETLAFFSADGTGPQNLAADSLQMQQTASPLPHCRMRQRAIGLASMGGRHGSPGL